MQRSFMENYKSLSELNKINHNTIIYVDTVNIILHIL